MPVRQKPDGWLEPEMPRASRMSVEREVDVSHAIEGSVSDGPPVLRVTPAQAAQRQANHLHPDRTRRRRKLRFAFILGALLLAIVPPMLAAEGKLSSAQLAFGALDSSALLAMVTTLKGILLLVAMGALSWRLRRRAARTQRAGYFAGVWAMALGTGLVATRAGGFSGSMLFDAGLLLVIACGIRDEYWRHTRATGTPA